MLEIKYLTQKFNSIKTTRIFHIIEHRSPTVGEACPKKHTHTHTKQKLLPRWSPKCTAILAFKAQKKTPAALTASSLQSHVPSASSPLSCIREGDPSREHTTLFLTTLVSHPYAFFLVHTYSLPPAPPAPAPIPVPWGFLGFPRGSRFGRKAT